MDNSSSKYARIDTTNILFLAASLGFLVHFVTLAYPALALFNEPMTFDRAVRPHHPKEHCLSRPKVRQLHRDGYHPLHHCQWCTTLARRLIVSSFSMVVLGFLYNNDY